MLEEGVVQFHLDVFVHELEPFIFDEVSFGDDDDAMLYAEEVADVEVFASLGHDAFIGGDHEHDEVDAGGAGDHGADELFVSGDVDDAEGEVLEEELGEAEFDGDAAAFFFGEAVRIDAGEGPHEAAFAVVDVSGGAEDHFFQVTLRRLCVRCGAKEGWAQGGCGEVARG